jgi:hypothetical protein
MAVEKPEDRYTSAKSLAQPVAGLDGDPPVPRQGGQHFLLLAPELHSQDISGEVQG